jgi:CDP-glucose 4,6-dehydratase
VNERAEHHDGRADAGDGVRRARSPSTAFYRGRRVLVLGDSGFKGPWLCEWLLALGADVHGVGLPPETTPALFDILDLRRRIAHHEVDVRDRQRLALLLRDVRPDVVFHLAGQALVLRSYREPLQTLDTNVIGTANVLAAIGGAGYTPDAPCAVVVAS